MGLFDYFLSIDDVHAVWQVVERCGSVAHHLSVGVVNVESLDDGGVDVADARCGSVERPLGEHALCGGSVDEHGAEALDVHVAHQVVNQVLAQHV